MSKSVNIEELINKATDAAIKRYRDKEKEEIKNKKYHNTELLLKNYNSFVEHCNNSKYSVEDIREIIEEDNLEIDDDELYIRSIRRSKIRTRIMVEHISIAIEALRQKMLEKVQIEKYDAIRLIYFDCKTYEEAAEELNCSEITVRRWKNEMIRELSTLIFGIEGLKLDI